jgi:hypothetical protein
MPKNPAAVELGKLSIAALTEKQRKQKSRNGGKASAGRLTKAERIARARKAAAARWSKKRGKRK